MHDVYTISMVRGWITGKFDDCPIASWLKKKLEGRIANQQIEKIYLHILQKCSHRNTTPTFDKNDLLSLVRQETVAVMRNFDKKTDWNKVFHTHEPVFNLIDDPSAKQKQPFSLEDSVSSDEIKSLVNKKEPVAKFIETDSPLPKEPFVVEDSTLKGSPQAKEPFVEESTLKNHPLPKEPFVVEDSTYKNSPPSTQVSSNNTFFEKADVTQVLGNNSPAETYVEDRPAKELHTLRMQRYNILRDINRGAFGIVFQGFDTLLQRNVAIKHIYRQMDSHDLHSFEKEAQTLASLNHPSIVQVYDCGVNSKNLPFIVMEFVQGEDIGLYVKDHKPGTVAVVNYMCQLVEALAYIHKRDIFHQDIKPANVLVTTETESPRIKLVDFGIAEKGNKIQERFAGTIRYSPPEKFGDGFTPQPTSDIYSFGAMFYEILTGEIAISEDNMELIYEAIMRGISFDEKHNSIDARLREICLKCVAIDPKNRYQNASELLMDLLDYSNSENSDDVSESPILCLIQNRGKILFPLVKRVNYIGRAYGNEIVVQDPTISRKQAVITLENDDGVPKVHITNLSKMTPVKIGKKDLLYNESAFLGENDRIQIASYTFYYIAGHRHHDDDHHDSQGELMLEKDAMIFLKEEDIFGKYNLTPISGINGERYVLKSDINDIYKNKIGEMTVTYTDDNEIYYPDSDEDDEVTGETTPVTSPTDKKTLQKNFANFKSAEDNSAWVADLTKTLAGNDSINKEVAVNMLLKIGPDALPVMLDTAVRFDVAIPSMVAVCKEMLPDVIPALSEQLTNSNPMICALVLNILSRLGTEGVKPLADLLDSQDTNLRKAAAAAILQMGPTVIPQMKHIAGTKQWTNTIMQWEKRAVPYLIAELQDEATETHAEKILLKMGRDILLELIRAILNKNIPAATRKKLKRLVFKMAPIRELVSLLTHKNEHVSKVAERLLVGFGHAATSSLAQNLRRVDDPLKVSLLKVLGKMGSKATKALGEIDRLLEHNNTAVKRMAQWAKKRIEDNS
ncbi:FHA domain-containing serine/threonine-protein kinase [Candidatus Uabimicrobium amorphum]|uniref:Protein kinase n=1 Tax=Uabimicrobium amorphum TaxID=2596890 RepID=A0A5S9IRF2_UABAM|nr:FHA domain-containing serine/threonine-protein kinase [Candidatus Uabimicrobium amorphum]BBM86534.1 protein kinase [Candidatus Uabimicrobium amorphum]